MPTTTDVRVNDLIINKMTQEQYDALPEKSPTELYVIEGDSNLIYAEQATALPTAGENNLGRLFQYVGETDQNYINGYFYKCTETGSSIVSGNATVTEYINMEGETPDPEYIPTFIFDKTVFDAYVLSQGKPENTSTSIIFTWDPDDETGDTLLTAHYNTNDSVSTILIDEAGEPLNQTYAILGFTTNFADPTEDPEAADQQWMNYKGHITIILPTVSSYAWENIDVQPAVDPLPDQTGQSGKFLTTDGTDASWSDKPLVNTAAHSNGTLTILGTPSNKEQSINIGVKSAITGRASVAVGDYSESNEYSLAIGIDTHSTGKYSVAIGHNAKSTAIGSILINSSSYSGYISNPDANTFKVANANGNFEIMSADGTIPEARLADTTSATQGQVLQLDSNNNAVWADVDSLPSQSGQNGKILGTDGTNAAWETKTTVSFRTWGVNE